jgi:hypothetical protein
VGRSQLPSCSNQTVSPNLFAEISTHSQSPPKPSPSVASNDDISSSSNLEVLLPSEENSEILEEEIFNDDPAMWKPSEFYRNWVALHGCSQNKDKNFQRSKREYEVGKKTVTRYLHASLFERKLQNGEKSERHWMIYSETKGSVFCAPCLLFGSDNSSFGKEKEGFNDWKNAAQRVSEHENSREHTESVLKLKGRASIKGRIDHELTVQLEAEVSYWRNVLSRVVIAVKALTSRGLPLRGHNEKWGSVHNGNFMMLLEFLSEFDPFLKEHIRQYGNRGSGTTSYLSKTIFEEIIEIMVIEVQRKIIDELKTAKYYSIIIDSTPDISHFDQLSFCLRYVMPDGTAVERFLTLLMNPGHKGEELYDAVVATLGKYDIEFADMRGQAYDNAANMSGVYKGLQGRIKAQNSYAEYTPCAAHRLNLIGTHAAESCLEAIEFFDVIEALYTFFSESTARWQILQNFADSKSIPLKFLSKTRWAARADAVRVLNEFWSEVNAALSSIAGNPNEKPVTKNRAKGLQRNMERLETAFMLVVWSTVLSRFNLVSKKIQSVSTSMSEIVDHYGSLAQFISDIRNNDFDLYESRAQSISVILQYEVDTRRQRRRTVRSDEPNEGHIEFRGRDNFKLNAYNVILDRLIVELREKHLQYKSIFEKYLCLLQLSTLSEVELKKEAKILQESFPNDLDPILFEDELHHFKIHCQQTGIEKYSPTKMLEHIRENGLEVVFPNVDITYRMLLCTAVTNCSAERSFSCLKRIKNYLRSTVVQTRLNSLMILAVESDLLLSINFDDIIKRFAETKARRKNFTF